MMRKIANQFCAQRLKVRNFSAAPAYHYKSDIEAKQIEKDIAEHGGVFVQRFPGMRGLELCEPHKGNYLTPRVLTTLNKRIRDLDSNWAVYATFVNSWSKEVYSLGLRDEDIASNGPELFEKVTELSSLLRNFSKASVSVFSGHMTGTPFGILLNSKYRCGTPSFKLRVTELMHGQIPTGGFAYHLCSMFEQGTQLSRYLAFSGEAVQATELFERRLLTHLTCERPYLAMTKSYGNSTSDEDGLMKNQVMPTSASAFEDALNDIDVNCSLDISMHPAWDRLLLVKAKPVPDEPLHPHNLNVIEDAVNTCFDDATLENIVRKLDNIPETWAQHTLSNMSKVDPLVLKTWFLLTRLAQHSTVEDMIALESKINLKLASMKELHREPRVPFRAEDYREDEEDLFSSPLEPTIVEPKKDYDTKALIANLEQVSSTVVDGLFELK